MTTAILYHPSFSRRSYLTQGSRLQDFPQALEPLLQDPRFVLVESPPIDESWILKVHTRDLLEGVHGDTLCSTAWHSAGGVVLGAEKIALGEARNAFAFIGAGGHHSGRDFFGGYCCFNDVVLAVTVLRERHGLRRFAILDTDAHHGDGTRDLVQDDPDVLHVCLCSTRYESPDGTKVDVPVPGGLSLWRLFGVAPDEPAAQQTDRDRRYYETAREAFYDRCLKFRPDLIFWYFGFDTHRGDYGDMGLTREAYLLIAHMVKELAEKVCQGRLEVVLGGGSRSDIARRCIPPIIAILGGVSS
uniref:Histone deacetylase n=1 Tax=Desulfacinum infernum TaxID=35837 RepID=A0A832EJ78_9BACT